MRPARLAASRASRPAAGPRSGAAVMRATESAAAAARGRRPVNGADHRELPRHHDACGAPRDAARDDGARPRRRSSGRAWARCTWRLIAVSMKSGRHQRHRHAMLGQPDAQGFREHAQAPPWSRHRSAPWAAERIPRWSRSARSGPGPAPAMAPAIALAPITGATKFTSATAREACGVSASRIIGRGAAQSGIEDGDVDRRRRVGRGQARDLRIRRRADRSSRSWQSAPFARHAAAVSSSRAASRPHNSSVTPGACMDAGQGRTDAAGCAGNQDDLLDLRT